MKMKEKWQVKSKIFARWFKQREVNPKNIFFPNQYDVQYSLQEKKEKNQSVAISDVPLCNKLFCNYMNKVVLVTRGRGFLCLQMCWVCIILSPVVQYCDTGQSPVFFPVGQWTYFLIKPKGRCRHEEGICLCFSPSAQPSSFLVCVASDSTTQVSSSQYFLYKDCREKHNGEKFHLSL